MNITLYILYIILIYVPIHRYIYIYAYIYLDTLSVFIYTCVTGTYVYAAGSILKWRMFERSADSTCYFVSFSMILRGNGKQW